MPETFPPPVLTGSGSTGQLVLLHAWLFSPASVLDAWSVYTHHCAHGSTLSRFERGNDYVFDEDCHENGHWICDGKGHGCRAEKRWLGRADGRPHRRAAVSVACLVS